MHAHAELLGHRDGRRRAAALDDQRLGVQVRQVELELVGAVGRVERRAGHAAGAGDEAGRHLGAVVEHDRDAVVAADAQAIEPLDGGADQAAQCAVRQRRPARRRNRRSGIGAPGEQVHQRRLHGFGSPVRRSDCAGAADHAPKSRVRRRSPRLAGSSFERMRRRRRTRIFNPDQRSNALLRARRRSRHAVDDQGVTT